MSLKLRNIETILCFIVLISIQHFPSRLAAAEPPFPYKSYPLTVNLDTADNVITSLHVKFRETEHNALIKEFIPNSDEDTFLLKWLDLGSRPNVEVLRRIIKTPIEEKQEQLILKLLRRDCMEKRDYFKIFSHIRLAQGGIFMCGIENDQRKVLGIQYEIAGNGNYLWNLTLPNSPFLSMFTRVYRLKLSPPSTAKSKVGIKQFDYEYSIHGESSENAVYLQFNGTLYDFDVLADEADPNDSVLSFYQEAWTTYVYKPYTEYADYFTHKSKKKILDSGKKGMEKGWYIGWQELHQKQGRRIYFILNADPLYIVLFENKAKKGQYQFVVRDAISGQFNLTNHYYSQYVDDLLNSKHFRNNILKDIKRQSELAFSDSKSGGIRESR